VQVEPKTHYIYIDYIRIEKNVGASIFIYHKKEYENTTNGKTSRTRICHVSLENQKFQLDRSKKVGRRSINQVRQCLVQAFHQAIELTLPALKTGNLLRPPHHLKAKWFNDDPPKGGPQKGLFSEGWVVISLDKNTPKPWQYGAPAG